MERVAQDEVVLLAKERVICRLEPEQIEARPLIALVVVSDAQRRTRPTSGVQSLRSVSIGSTEAARRAGR